MVFLDKEIVYVTAYETSLGYGGPEEGGWWFDCGEWVETVQTSRPTAEKIKGDWQENEYMTRRPTYSSIHRPGDSYDVVIEEAAPQDYPVESPRYE
jgi:hypothetical protein